jgi:hypothetical protein
MRRLWQTAPLLLEACLPHDPALVANTMRPSMKTAACVLAAAAAWGSSAALAAEQCSVRAGAAPTIVELYTSEGCSSCPPADRWLSTLKGRNDVIALAFHVNYWDKLGWPDRFASPELTERQHQRASQAGSSYVYTPQVMADGRDWRQWPKLPARSEAAAPSLTLTREGEQVTASVDATRGAARLSGYWAVLEDNHVSKVRAGENAGETLRHDHVVRLYKPVAAWNAAEAQRASLTVSAGAAEYPRRVVFVVTEASSQRPVQALALPLKAGC